MIRHFLDKEKYFVQKNDLCRIECEPSLNIRKLIKHAIPVFELYLGVIEFLLTLKIEVK